MASRALRTSQIATLVALTLSGVHAIADKTGQQPVLDPIKATLADRPNNDWSVCGPHGCAPVDEICGTWGCAQTRHICSSSGCGATYDEAGTSNGTAKRPGALRNSNQVPLKVVNLAESPTQTVLASAQGTPIKGPICTSKHCRLVALQVEGSTEIRWNVCGPFGCMPFDEFMADGGDEADLKVEADLNVQADLNVPADTGKSEL